MTKLNNPASRLHTILSAAFKHKPEKKMQIVWQELFKFGNQELDKIASVQPKLIGLSYEIVKGINKIGLIHSKDIYINKVNHIAEAIYNLGHVHKMAQLRDAIPDESLDILYICSDLFNSNNYNEKILLEKDLDDLKDSIESLIKDIGSLDIEIDFKEILITHLNELKISITFYQINGIDGFKASIEKFIGSLLINKDSFRNFQSAEETKNVFSVLFKIIDKINKLVLFAKNTKLALPLIADVFNKITLQ